MRRVRSRPPYYPTWACDRCPRIIPVTRFERVNMRLTHNPYDFANPVRDEALFAGRRAEIETIEYYLHEARQTRRPINLALLGPRAAGKTSLLNMVQRRATDQGFLVVRLDL